MPTEYEAKILDVDLDALERLILSCGGRKVRSAFFRRYVYDISPPNPAKWIRLRTDGSKHTLAVKHILSDAVDGTQEIEIAVHDFATTAELLNQIGFTAKSYQENTRTSYELGDVKLEIDQWPLIPAYLEIEGNSVNSVHHTAQILGYSIDDLVAENTAKIYRRYGINLAAITKLEFAEEST